MDDLVRYQMIYQNITGHLRSIINEISPKKAMLKTPYLKRKYHENIVKVENLLDSNKYLFMLWGVKLNMFRKSD